MNKVDFMERSKIIAVDFDPTCIKHEYPEIGEDVPPAVMMVSPAETFVKR